VLVGPEAQARGIRRNEERGDALRARLTGARHDDVDGCLAGARDELLDPVRTYSSPSAMALVVIAAASEPAPGSVRQ
jgi:hypothetical protein